MNLDKRLFINVIPGDTFLDKLSGTTKVRLFFALIILLVATWDIRILLPVFLLGLIGLISIKPNWRLMAGIIGFIVITNLFNLFLVWVVSPDYGASIVGGSTLLLKITDRYIITAETMWYFLVRFSKFMATFLVSLTFIQSITPSEMAAGLYSIKVPYKVATIVSIAFRYIPEISRDFNDVKISMQARGMELDAKKTSLFERLKQNVVILVPLIIVSFDRVGNIANAMDLRGYGRGKTRTY
ncbi:MAG: energy-coupling factor transporter transmembrane protein EcfT, partial [Lachnospiraceae bacterium]|nr:energy-coupling factor transporter transmembrane protein EcfT [Lachnospiraceae bacterium]